MKFKLSHLKYYFILFPFLYPRGFCEYFPIYKMTMLVWLYIAIVVIVIDFIYKTMHVRMKMEKALIFFECFFGVMILETILVRGTIGEGLQKMFATPVLCMYIALYLKINPYQILNTICNILLFDNIINCTLLSPFCLEKVMGKGYIGNIMFIGHVQMCAQIAILGITVSFLLYFGYGRSKKAKVLIGFSILTMFLSNAIASYLTIIVLLIAFVIWKGRKHYIISAIPFKTLFLIGTIFQSLIIAWVLYYKIDFGARYYVWIDVLSKLQGHLTAGYGVYGVLLHTFWMEWTGVDGMNYAHNEVLQMLLDGGVILMLLYIIVCFVILNKTTYKNNNITYWINCSLFVFLMDGICESVTEYNYFYIFLMIIFLFSQDINKLKEQEVRTNG